MKKLLLFLFSFFFYQCYSQSNIVSITSVVPTNLAVCGSAQTFTVTLYNPSPFPVVNDTLFITLPAGIVYQAGSISGSGVSEQNISNLNNPVFLLPTIASLATAINITFTAKANCDVISYISNGGIIQNTVKVKFTANGAAGQDTHTTSVYNAKQPVLNISNITNATYNGTIGASFTRCVTITNSGLGDLSQFTVTDVHGSGVSVTAVNNGTWTNSGTTETITFGSTNFSAIGNNNAIFEPGESISFCETVLVSSCNNVSSDFTAKWGCNNQTCQTVTLGANVVFPNLIPNIQITPVSPPMNSCLGTSNASVQRMLLVNTGTGNAVNIHLDIFQTNNGQSYNNNMGSFIDATSFVIEGSNTPITPDSTKTTSVLACMPANSIGRAYITIPSIPSGDSVYITWNTYSCCYNRCTSTGQSYFNGWGYKGSYENSCQNSYVINAAWGRVHSQLFVALQNNFSTAVLDSGQIGTFNFLVSSFVQQQPYPSDGTAYWKIVYTVPPCLTITGGPAIHSSNGIDVWTPLSVTSSNDTITAIFSGSVPPFDLNQAQIKLNLKLLCNGCSGGDGLVKINLTYVPSTSCGCEVSLACTNTTLTTLCSTVFIVIPEPSESECYEGMMLRNYSFKRTNYGLPDNEVGGGNGTPDNSGALNLSQIATDRAMFGDTISESLHGKVRTSITNPTWQYCYALSSIQNGNLINFLNSQLLIYRSGSLFATCNNINPTITISTTTKTFSYNLSASVLISNGCVPSGFLYQNADSVVFVANYKVTTNTTGPIIKLMSFNEYYLSSVPNPTLPTDKKQCQFAVGQAYVLGYKFESKEDTYYTISNCDTAILTQSYYLSIGPCCSNYEGGNLFPFEYRNWAHMNTLAVKVPVGYHFVSANVVEKRTAGLGASVTNSAISVQPTNPDSTTLVFPVEQIYQGYGGLLLPSDDGFSGKLDVVVVPTCNVTPVISQGIKYDWTFSPNSNIQGTGSFPSTISIMSDYIIYNAPSIFLQTVQATLNAPDSIVMWDIIISNPSNNSNAGNVWLSAPAISGLNIVEVFDVNNNVVVPLSGNLYQLGTALAASDREFQIKATYSSCNQDSIILYAGWDCAGGYPVDVASYPCTPQQITLTAIPNLPAIDLFLNNSPTLASLCDTNTYIIEGINFQAGTLYNSLFKTVLPAGTQIVSGSSQLLYPGNTPFVTIPNPILESGTIWAWDLSDINSIIEANGLVGFGDTTKNSFQIKFKVVTNCNYTSGDVLHFIFNGNAACGLNQTREILSNPLFISGATPLYSTNISLSTNFISPCANTSLMHVSIVNNGSDPIGATDSITIELPFGVSFEPASFVGVHNAPTNTSPVQNLVNSQTALKWKLPAGIVSGDSIVFDFNYYGLPEESTCGISSFIAKTISISSVVCTSTGNPCNIGVINGQDTLPVFTYKGYLSFDSPTAYSEANPPTGELAHITFNINNTGQSVFAEHNTIISYYADTDGNSIYSPTDVFITYDTLNALIPTNGDYLYSSSIAIPVGQACKIIALLDTAISFCSCSPTQISIDIPVMSISSDTAICSQQIITIGNDSINGYTYSWSPNTNISSTTSSSTIYTAPSVSSVSDTSYYYVTTNRIGCVSIDTMRIITSPAPSVSVSGTDTICFGESNGMASINISGYENPPYTIVWSTSPVQQNDTAIGLSAGTYSVTLTDNGGCEVKDSITIYQTSTPILANITSQTNLTCYTTCNGTATINVSGGAGGYTYLWSTQPIQNSTTATSLCSETYTVTATDINGCSASDSVTISSPPQLVASTALNNTTCNSNNSATASATAVGGIAPYTYVWSTGQTTANIINLGSGTYIITVTDSANCSTTDTSTIFPAVSLSTSTTGSSICEGDTSIISTIISGGIPVYSFVWSNAATSESITVSPLVSSTYTVVVTDGNQCTDTAEVTINVRPLPIVDFQPDSIGCSPLCVNFTNLSTISSGSNQQWNWDFGDGSNAFIENPSHCFTNINPNNTVNYTVSLTVTSNEGCNSTATKNNYITVFPHPIADFNYTPSLPTTLNPIISFENTSIGSTNWMWNFLNNSDTITSILESPYYTCNDTGTLFINLIATNSYLCSDTIETSIIVGQDWAIYIPNAFSPDDNGINDEFFAKTYGIKKLEMLIFDRWGNLLFESTEVQSHWDGKANKGNEIAQMDVYIYVINAIDIFDEKHKYRGTVTLIR
jgi:gliding motility-associated-like protein